VLKEEPSIWSMSQCSCAWCPQSANSSFLWAFIIPCFQILDFDYAEEESGLLPTKHVLLRQTQVYFLIVTLLFFSHILSFLDEFSLIQLLKNCCWWCCFTTKM